MTTNNIKRNNGIIGIIYNGHTQHAITATIVKTMAVPKTIKLSIAESVRAILDKYNNKYHRSKPPVRAKSLAEFNAYWAESGRRKDTRKRTRGSTPIANTALYSGYMRATGLNSVDDKIIAWCKTEPWAMYMADWDEVVRGANYETWASPARFNLDKMVTLDNCLTA